MSPAREFEVRVSGTSMMPTLRPGDICRVRAGKPSRLRTGDVIVYWGTAQPVVHRVVICRGARIYTRGDAHLRPDPAVPRDAILGLVVAARRGDRPLSLHNSGSQRYTYLVFTWMRAALLAALCRLFPPC